MAPESVRPFREVWAVYDGLEVAFDDECALATFEGAPIMWGLNAGRTNAETMEYAATGIVMEALGAFDGVLGTGLLEAGGEESLDEEVARLIEERNEARKNRDFAAADRIRDDLKARGIILEDGPGGTTWKKG